MPQRRGRLTNISMACRADLVRRRAWQAAPPSCQLSRASRCACRTATCGCGSCWRRRGTGACWLLTAGAACGEACPAGAAPLFAPQQPGATAACLVHAIWAVGSPSRCLQQPVPEHGAALAAGRAFYRSRSPCIAATRLAPRRCALLGDKLGRLAVQNGWSGVVVNGCVRDCATLAQLDVGIKALAPCPVKSSKRDPGLKAVGAGRGAPALLALLLHACCPRRAALPRGRPSPLPSAGLLACLMGHRRVAGPHRL